MKMISPQALHQKRTGSARLLVIDVRTRDEHSQVHIDGTTVLPLSELRTEDVLSIAGSADSRVYLLCRTGARARLATERLETGGFGDCVVVDGGIAAWIKAGLPVVRGVETSLNFNLLAAAFSAVLGLAGVSLLVSRGHPIVSILAWVAAALVYAVLKAPRSVVTHLEAGASGPFSEAGG